MFNVFNRGMKTKSFKEIVPIKRSSSGPTNSANKLSPLKTMRVWQDSLGRRYFLLFDLGDQDISLYHTGKEWDTVRGCTKHRGRMIFICTPFLTFKDIKRWKSLINTLHCGKEHTPPFWPQAVCPHFEWAWIGLLVFFGCTSDIADITDQFVNTYI